MKEALTNRSYVQQEKRTNRPYVLGAIMMAMFMSAVEATIVSTAMPAIVADLGGFSQYSWVFSSYLLMNSVTVLIYGKLSDLLGRKPVITFGIIVFLVGSLLCGLADTMTMLIAFRFLQGFGAGAIMPIATTIVGDLYTKEERVKIQGYLASVWGISAVLGPVLGGIFVQYFSWHFVFWLNIPLGLLAIGGLWLFLHEKIEKRERDIDYLGAFLLTVSISSLMIVLVEGGVYWPWKSPQSLGLIGICFIALLIFFIHERRVKEPMMPLVIWKEKAIFIANVVSLMTGVLLIGLSTFLPTYVQGVMEQSALVAGFTLTAMSIGWPIASTFSGRLLLLIGFRATSIIGGMSLILGSIVFITLSDTDGPIWAAIGSFLVGIGMGLTSTAFIVLIQSTVSWNQRGIATASNMFMRNLGSAIGAALLGGILNKQLQGYLQTTGLSTEIGLDAANILLNEKLRNNLTDDMKEALQQGLAESLHTIFIAIGAFAVISFLLIWWLPGREAETPEA